MKEAVVFDDGLTRKEDCRDDAENAGGEEGAIKKTEVDLNSISAFKKGRLVRNKKGDWEGREEEDAGKKPLQSGRGKEKR